MGQSWGRRLEVDLADGARESNSRPLKRADRRVSRAVLSALFRSGDSNQARRRGFVYWLCGLTVRRPEGKTPASYPRR
jgi:hypothetical protein